MDNQKKFECALGYHNCFLSLVVHDPRWWTWNIHLCTRCFTYLIIVNNNCDDQYNDYTNSRPRRINKVVLKDFIGHVCFELYVESRPGDMDKALIFHLELSKRHETELLECVTREWKTAGFIL